MRGLLLVTMMACTRGKVPAERTPDVLPPWLAYRPVTGGLTLEGVVDQHVTVETRPNTLAVLPTRVIVAADSGIQNLVAHADDAGNVRERAFDVAQMRLVPFTGPVVAYAPIGGPWFVTPRHAAIVKDGIEIVGDGARWRFPNPHGFTAIAAGCLARPLPSTEPSPCFDKLPRPGEPIVLVQTSTIGPLSRVEWNALATMERALLAGWERAGGPRADAEVLQIAGSWGRSDGAWHAPYRPALVCGVLADHTVACWGTSQYYELGDGKRSTDRRYARVPGLTDVVEVAVGENFACARTSRNRIACWGNTAGGRFPLPKQPSGAAAARCTVDEAATERTYRERVARAEEAARACASRSCPPGTLDCHLGCGPNPVERTPVYRRDASCIVEPVFRSPQWLDVENVISISAGHATACFLHANGYTSCGGG